MKVAVHQPQYLPWIGYFHKIMNVDVFVFLDNVQYKKREFQNRNKIKTSQGPIWLTVPAITKGRFYQKIKDVEINNTERWKEKHFEAIKRNYSKAKYFRDWYMFLEELYSKGWNKLIDLNVFIIKKFIEYLEIEVEIFFETELNITGEKTERIINICKKLDADTYYSGVGARDYLEEEKFKEEEINLEYQNFSHPVYPQIYGDFISHLSILDLFLNCGKESRKIISGN